MLSRLAPALLVKCHLTKTATYLSLISHSSSVGHQSLSLFNRFKNLQAISITLLAEGKKRAESNKKPGKNGRGNHKVNEGKMKTINLNAESEYDIVLISHYSEVNNCFLFWCFLLILEKWCLMVF